MEQTCKCFSDEKIQLALAGDLVERWCNREQAKILLEGIYAVALSARQKTLVNLLATLMI
jgi:hypothetical protein